MVHQFNWLNHGKACVKGTSIVNARTESIYRHSYVSSHSVDAVLPLANNVTVIGHVATTLANLIITWVQTTSGFDTLFVTVPGDWTTSHRPVISRKMGDMTIHTLYTGYSPLESNGQLVLFDYGCSMENLVVDTQKNMTRFTCRGCNSSCNIPLVSWSRSLLPSSASIVRTMFPQEQAATEWAFTCSTHNSCSPVFIKVRLISWGTFIKVKVVFSNIFVEMYCRKNNGDE